MNIDRIIHEYDLKPFGVKGWMSSKKMPCYQCGRFEKFGIILNKKGVSSYHCFYAGCGVHGTLHSLLKKLGRFDLISEDKETIDLQDKIEILQTESINTECNEISYPIGFRKVEAGGLRYLNARGWKEEQYKQFSVGKTNLDPYFKGYILFSLKENGKLVGLLGRSAQSKQWHKENPDVLRYKNSKGVDFGKIIGGYDELIDNTKAVYIVEGIMDKVNMDNVFHQLRLKGVQNIDNAKVVFTNGAKISETQILKLKAKGIQFAYLMYDAGVIVQVQSSALSLLKHIPNVKIIEVKGEKDPGDFTCDDFLACKYFNVLDYKINRLECSLKV